MCRFESDSEHHFTFIQFRGIITYRNLKEVAEMSQFRDLIIEIQQEVDEGELTFRQIAEKHGVSVSFVTEIYCGMVEKDMLS